MECEQALWSRMGRRGKREKIVKRGRGLGGRRGKGEGREPVDKGLQPPFRPLVIDLSLICHVISPLMHWKVNRSHVKIVGLFQTSIKPVNNQGSDQLEVAPESGAQRVPWHGGIQPLSTGSTALSTPRPSNRSLYTGYCGKGLSVGRYFN